MSGEWTFEDCVSSLLRCRFLFVTLKPYARQWPTVLCLFSESFLQTFSTRLRLFTRLLNTAKWGPARFGVEIKVYYILRINVLLQVVTKE